MRVETRRVRSGRGEAVIVKLDGEWDSLNLFEVIRLLEAEAAAANPTCTGLALDVVELRFVNSSCLGYLIKVSKGEDGKVLNGLPLRVVLVNPSKFLGATLHSLGLDHIFKIAPTVDAALTELRRIDFTEAPSTPAP